MSLTLDYRAAPVEPPDPLAPLRREFLRGRDVSCPGCGYNLRNTQADRCPECGGRLTLVLASQRPPLGAFAACVAAIAAPAGFAATLAVAGWVEVWREGRLSLPRADWHNLLLCTTLALLAPVAIAGTARLLGPSLRWSGRARWAIAGALLAGSALSIVLLNGLFALVYQRGGLSF